MDDSIQIIYRETARLRDFADHLALFKIVQEHYPLNAQNVTVLTEWFNYGTSGPRERVTDLLVTDGTGNFLHPNDADSLDLSDLNPLIRSLNLTQLLPPPLDAPAALAEALNNLIG